MNQISIDKNIFIRNRYADEDNLRTGQAFLILILILILMLVMLSKESSKV